MSARALTFFFILWVVGVQVAELFAVIGVVGVALVLLANLRTRPTIALEWKLLAAFLVSAVLAPLLAGKLPNLTSFARLLSLATIPLAAVAAARLSPRSLRTALLAGGVTLLLSCLAAALQHFGVWPSAERMQHLAALKLPFARVYEEVPGAPGHFMAGGLLLHRLKFAHISALVVLTSVGFAITEKGRARAFAIAVAAVGLVSIFWFPFARAATVALAVALLVPVAVSLRRGVSRGGRRGLWAAGLSIVLFFALALAVNEPLRARLLRSDSEEGSGGRRHLLAAGLSAVKDHPFTGLGLGGFRVKDHLPADAPAYVLEHQGKTHNQPLSIAAESGVPAALLFAVFFLLLARRLWSAALTSPSGPSALLFFFALCALHDPLFHAEFGLALGLALGIPLRRSAPPADVAAKVHPFE